MKKALCLLIVCLLLGTMLVGCDTGAETSWDIPQMWDSFTSYVGELWQNFTPHVIELWEDISSWSIELWGDLVSWVKGIPWPWHTHTPVIDAAVAPTCTESGLTEGSHCADCGKVLTEQTVLPAAHKPLPTPAVEPTCMDMGLTEGSACADCGEALTGRQPIPVKRTHPVANGTCTVCGARESTPGLEFYPTQDGSGFVVSGIGSCTASEIYIGLHEGISVIEVGTNAFFECETITSVELDDTVIAIGNSAFWNCDALLTVDIPDSVTEIGDYAFWNCHMLSYVGIPDSVSAIGSSAFFGCHSLLESDGGLLYVDRWLADVEDVTPETVTLRADTVGIVRNAFLTAREIAAIQVPEDAVHYCSIDGNLYSKDGKTLVIYAIGKKDTTFTVPAVVTKIAADAFEEADNLTALTFAEGSVCESIGEDAFMGCSALLSVSLPDTLIEIGENAFYACNSLTAVSFADGASCETVGRRAFYECASLVSCVLPNSVTVIGGGAFAGCAALSEFRMPRSLLGIEADTFAGCDSLIERDGGVLYVDCWAVGYIEGVEVAELREGTVGIGDDAFAECTTMTEIYLPSSVAVIGERAFIWCSALREIYIPAAVKEIGWMTFAFCEALSSVVFEGESLCEEIGGYAFRDCRALPDIFIPIAVERVGEYAFFGCSALEILTEHTEKPSGWHEKWNSSNRPVVWDVYGEN